MKTLAILAVLVAIPSLAAADEGSDFIGHYTTNCPSPNQCGLTIMTSPTDHGPQLWAAFTVTTQDNDELPMCNGSGGVVFPMLPVKDYIVSTNKEFAVRITKTPTGLNVDGIPDRLCQVVLRGAYQEIGD